MPNPLNHLRQVEAHKVPRQADLGGMQLFKLLSSFLTHLTYG